MNNLQDVRNVDHAGNKDVVVVLTLSQTLVLLDDTKHLLVVNLLDLVHVGLVVEELDHHEQADEFNGIKELSIFWVTNNFTKNVGKG